MKKYRLDISKKSNKLQNFEDYFRSKVIGQEKAVERLSGIYRTYLAGLNPRRRPLANVLLLGPTGVGKTLLCESVAEFFDVGLVKVNCSELSESHTVAHLTGSPPGYVSRDDPPMITTGALEKQPSVVLFDELEKAHSKIYDALLGIMDKAEMNTNKGMLNFEHSFIFFTSNIGSEEMAKLHQGMGFQHDSSTDINKDIENVSMSALKKRFKPEFLNRLDATLVFNVLGTEELRQILNNELNYLQGRIMLSKVPFVLLCTQAAKKALVEDGYEPKYGARHIKRSLERNITEKLSAITTSGQVEAGDLIEVNYENGEFVFDREPLAAVTPVTAALEKQNLVLFPKEKEKIDKTWLFKDGGYF